MSEKNDTQDVLLLANTNAQKILRQSIGSGEFPTYIINKISYKKKVLYFMVATREGKKVSVHIPGFRFYRECKGKNGVRFMELTPFSKKYAGKVVKIIKNGYPDLKDIPFNFW